MHKSLEKEDMYVEKVHEYSCYSPDKRPPLYPMRVPFAGKFIYFHFYIICY